MLSPRTHALIDAALDEDIGQGDVTTRLTVEPGVRARAMLLARERLVLAGSEVFAEVFRRVDPSVEVRFSAADGDRVEAGTAIATVAGPAASILGGERLVLNFLQHLSGIATLTRAFVDAVPKGARARIVDTRKTTPGWREIERAAVRAGGGVNHRADLSGGILVKDNHVDLAGGVRPAVE